MKIFNLFKPHIEELKTGKKVTTLIKALIYHNDWNTRQSAAKALTAIGWEPINGDGIYYLIALNDWNKLIHIGAPSVEPLIQVLKDKDIFDLHRESIKALGAIKDKRTIEPLIELLQNEKIYLSEDVVKALGKIADDKFVNTLLSVLKNETSYTLR